MGQPAALGAGTSPGGGKVRRVARREAAIEIAAAVRAFVCGRRLHFCPRRAGLSPGLSERCAGAAARSGVARAAMGAAARERQPGGSLMNAPCSCRAQSEGETEKRCDLLPPSRGS